MLRADVLAVALRRPFNNGLLLKDFTVAVDQGDRLYAVRFEASAEDTGQFLHDYVSGKKEPVLKLAATAVAALTYPKQIYTQGRSRSAWPYDDEWQDAGDLIGLYRAQRGMKLEDCNRPNSGDMVKQPYRKLYIPAGVLNIKGNIVLLEEIDGDFEKAIKRGYETTEKDLLLSQLFLAEIGQQNPYVGEVCVLKV